MSVISQTAATLARTLGIAHRYRRLRGPVATTPKLDRNVTTNAGTSLRALLLILDEQPRSAKYLAALAGLPESKVRSAIDQLRNRHLAVWYSPSARGFWTDCSPPLPESTICSVGRGSTRWHREPTNLMQVVLQ